MGKLNAAQKMKRDFRASKKWKEFRHRKNVEQEGTDPITLKKLLKGANLHHLDDREENYQNIDEPKRFVYLNKKTHDTIHFLYNYYKKDPKVLERMKEYLELMIKFSND